MALLHGFLGRLLFGEAQVVYQNSDGTELEKSVRFIMGVNNFCEVVMRQEGGLSGGLRE